MKRLFHCVVALVLCASDTQLHSQQTPNAQSREKMQPEAVMRSLYREVVARRPVGIPTSADMKTFAPYLSEPFLHRIDLARACENDYYRKYQNPNEKPELEWLEFELFTGGDEKVSPWAFHVERTQRASDGSIRVYVRLKADSPSKPWIWRVAAIAVRENFRFVLDDIIFLGDETTDHDFRLSEILALGMRRPSLGWVRRGAVIDEKSPLRSNSPIAWKMSVIA